MTVVLVLIQVVGSHDGPCPTLTDGSLEGRQVDFTQGAVRDDDIHLMAILLIVVQRIVLDTGGHALRLQALHVGHYHTGGQPGVFTHILKVTAVERCAVDVDTGTEYHGLATIERFLAEALTIDTCHLRVPRSSQTGQRRECHARVIRLASLLPLVPQHVRTYAVRAVVGPHIGNTETLHARGAELRLCMNDGNLLVECHALQGILHTLLQGLRLV